jgi:pantetheine-phosphate adenylyltransferase
MRIAVYPGSFDPLTNGHLDIIERSVHIFDKVILSIATDNNKDSMFSITERIDMITEALKKYETVEVEAFEGLLVRYAMKKNACALIRGLRAVSDFEYEFQMSLMNRKLEPAVETVFLMTSAENTFISSSLIKQVASLQGDIHGLVPQVVEEAMLRKNKGD